MSKGAKVRNKERRKSEKAKKKAANYLRTGPKVVSGDTRARKRLKGESQARKRKPRKRTTHRKKYLGQGVRR